ncbi:DM13 domain-containing protein [Sinomonas mesophila]|uniref:DM13 domain-containing protein n=1 Tax=Sinomonas mesophila TaxID=1531955 RepID=UPI0009854828|nr:DM13 domain-containing protein [Sinomonas mesophila]
MALVRSARRAVRAHPVLSALAAIAVGVLIGVGLYLFQPWRLFTSSTLVEAAPSATQDAGAQTPAPSPPPGAAPSSSAPSESPGEPAAPTAPAAPRVLAQGAIISHEHASSGTVRVLELADGSRVLRFESLDTSDGPDLRVWLTDAPVLEGNPGWHVFDDGRYLDLGELKANHGDQNYPIPPEADLAQYTSVSVWCRRFAVSFGAAALAAP